MRKKESDGYRELLWQHCGQGFRARMLFRSGFVSGPSAVLEPYAVPRSFPRFASGALYVVSPPFLAAPVGLAVGEAMIQALLQYYDQPVASAAQHVRTDGLGRRAVEFVMATPTLAASVPTWQPPSFLPESFDSYALERA